MAGTASGRGPIRVAIVAKLGSSVTLGGVALPVLTSVPSSTALPFILVSCSETAWRMFDSSGSQVEVELHVWVRGVGVYRYDQVESVASQVRALLDGQTLTVASGTFVGCLFERNSGPSEVPDNQTLHDILYYRAWIQGL